MEMISRLSLFMIALITNIPWGWGPKNGISVFCPNSLNLLCFLSLTEEAEWPSGLGAGLVIQRSLVQILLPATEWICLRWSRPNSTPPSFVNSQLFSLLPVGILSKFLFLLTVSTISTTVLNTFDFYFELHDALLR